MPLEQPPTIRPTPDTFRCNGCGGIFPAKSVVILGKVLHAQACVPCDLKYSIANCEPLGYRRMLATELGKLLKISAWEAIKISFERFPENSGAVMAKKAEIAFRKKMAKKGITGLPRKYWPEGLPLPVDQQQSEPEQPSSQDPHWQDK